MSYECQILADSISPDGKRLTTYSITFPRFILAEVNTHRALSRNSASSRAIPPEKQIQRVIDHPFVPEFGSRVVGMGEGSLDDESRNAAKRYWFDARDAAVAHANMLLQLNVDKSRINRLLEPFMWHTAIVSATEWSNFFALRDHPAAQGEFQIIARMMREAMEKSQPTPLLRGKYATPLLPLEQAVELGWERAKQISAGRVARVSYDRAHEEETYEASMTRCQGLIQSGHLSPLEHVARPCREDEMHVGNFLGWQQYRAEIPYQEDFGARP
jgi:thymidylate synthase ThyX